jgi:hypothetical protein
MNRYVLFTDRGARIVKGDAPQSGSYIQAPAFLPLNIPMHYWKLQDGAITQMSPEEKLVVDQAISVPVDTNQSVSNNVQLLRADIDTIKTQISDISSMISQPDPNQQQIIDLTDKLSALSLAPEIKQIEVHKIDPLALASLEKDFEDLKEEFEKADKSTMELVEEMNDQLRKAEETASRKLVEFKQQLEDHAKSIEQNAVNFEKSHLEQGLSLKSHIGDKISELEKETEDKISSAKNYVSSLVKEELSKLPESKIEQIYIVNKFKIKEYAQIAIISGAVFVILRMLLH